MLVPRMIDLLYLDQFGAVAMHADACHELADDLKGIVASLKVLREVEMVLRDIAKSLVDATEVAGVV